MYIRPSVDALKQKPQVRQDRQDWGGRTRSDEGKRCNAKESRRNEGDRRLSSYADARKQSLLNVFEVRVFVVDRVLYGGSLRLIKPRRRSCSVTLWNDPIVGSVPQSSPHLPSRLVLSG